MMRNILLLTALTASTTGFTIPSSSTKSHTKLSAFNEDDANNFQSYDPLNLSNDELYTTNNNGRTATAITTALLTASTPLVASANDSPNWGIFEGRTLSLLHPAMMGSMALFSLSTALLGFQWRRQRTIGDEISTLKKTLPNLNGAASVKDAIVAAESSESVDTAYVSSLKGALSIESNIEELQKERKELAGASPRDKHFNQGSLLLFIGIAFAIEVSFCFIFWCNVVTSLWILLICGVEIMICYISFTGYPNLFVGWKLIVLCKCLCRIFTNIANIPYTNFRDHLTHMHVLVNFSPVHTYMQELVLLYFGHWLLPWFLLCKKVMILLVLFTLLPTLVVLVCSFGRLLVVFLSYLR